MRRRLFGGPGGSISEFRFIDTADVGRGSARRLPIDSYIFGLIVFGDALFGHPRTHSTCVLPAIRNTPVLQSR